MIVEKGCSRGCSVVYKQNMSKSIHFLLVVIQSIIQDYNRKCNEKETVSMSDLLYTYSCVNFIYKILHSIYDPIENAYVRRTY